MNRLLPNPKNLANRASALITPAVLGLGIWAGFPTATAYQDMGSLISGTESGDTRWNTFVQRSVAGSVHAAELPFANGDVQAANWSGAGLKAKGLGAVAFRAPGGAAASSPDETRVTRGEKRGRIVEISPVAPPKFFNAGSIFERTSGLFRSSLDPDLRMAFVKSDIEGREVQIASQFYLKADEAKGDRLISSELASLVNNDKADILATAYAPAGPDYAEASPFASLLRDDDPLEGRFVPPVGRGDHAWMKEPLPPAVFSKAEQKCLAVGIYFEARGENLRGQAAVGQVILNRVRAPTYPDTICDVVYQNDHLKNRCQFSFACDGIKDRILNQRAYRMAEEVALAVTAGKIFIPEVGSSTHYHATYVKPGWSNTMKKMKQIGLHVFYRTYGGGWR